MKPLINTLLKQLDALTHVLEEKGYLGWYIGEVSRLRGIISGAKTPHVPSRTLWDRYTFILTAIEEVAIVAKKAGYDFALYSMITSLREQVIEFKSALERAYTLEKIQVSMPVVLGISLVIFKTINSASTLSWIYYAISIISIISALINPVLSLIGTGFLGVMMMLIEGDASGLLTGSLLLFVSALYVYLLYMSKSSKFEKKVEELAVNIRNLIEEELAPKPFRLEEALPSLTENCRIISTGIFTYLDRDALLKYKATLLLMAGFLAESTVLQGNKSFI
ncbi:MAG: hypothetical protein QXK88_00205 [Desulfurococcaceae archaeon]